MLIVHIHTKSLILYICEKKKKTIKNWFCPTMGQKCKFFSPEQ